MVYRVRSETDFPAVFYHSSIGAIRDGALTSGLHVVTSHDLRMDLFLEDLRSETLIVTFSAALSEAVRTLPAFQGIGLARRAGQSCLAVSDPSIEGSDLDLGWCLGRRGQQTVEHELVNAIRVFQTELGTKRTLFFGASGGGYSAILVGRHFEEASILCVNPRLSFLGRPRVDLRRTYGKLSRNNEWEAPPSRTILEAMPSAFELISRKLLGKLYIFQNSGDEVFFNNQFLPFLRQAKTCPPANLFCRSEWTGKGHSEVPKETLDELVAGLLGSEGNALGAARAGFLPVANNY